MKKLSIILFLLFLSSCGVANPYKISMEVAPPVGVNKISIMEKYNLATEIKAKYQLDGNTLKRTTKDDPKDKIEIKIGEPTEQLEPKLTLSRWEEVNFSVKPKNYDKIVLADKNLRFEGEKTIFETPKEDYNLYEMPVSADLPEGGFEYEIILKEKPAVNIIEFQLETQGLNFFYQPALTQQEIDEGASRPENVIGSYAVYASEQKTNWTGGKEYKAGKVGHIYRPKIIDSAGNWIWGVLNINKTTGILSVEIPQEFLDNAVYPIRHAAGLTFGYTTLGASATASAIANFSSTASLTRGQNHTLSGNGTLDSIHLGMISSLSTQALDIFAVIYREDSAGANSHDLVASVEQLNLSITTTAAFYTFTAASELLTADDYILGGIGNGEDMTEGNISLRLDSGGTKRNYVESTTGVGSYNTRKSENPWTGIDGSTANNFSIYATYTASGGAEEPPSQSPIIIFE